jgi:hypothetical protein
MFGHAKEVGYVTTEAYGSAVLFRCDTPELPEREYVLESPEYAADGATGTRWAPVGAKVKRPASPAKSRLIGPGKADRESTRTRSKRNSNGKR